MQEYRSFAGSSKSRRSDAQFIEMFDLDCEHAQQMAAHLVRRFHLIDVLANRRAASYQHVGSGLIDCSY